MHPSPGQVPLQERFSVYLPWLTVRITQKSLKPTLTIAPVFCRETLAEQVPADQNAAHGTCRHSLADWGLIQIVGRGSLIRLHLVPQHSGSPMLAEYALVLLGPKLHHPTGVTQDLAGPYPLRSRELTRAQKMAPMRTPPRWSSPPKAETH